MFDPNRRYWAVAPKRHRKRRIQKKIDARHGAMHYLPRPMRRLPYYSWPPDDMAPFVLSLRKRPMRAPTHAANLLFSADHNRCIVAKDWVGDVEVSTVFLRHAAPHFGGPPLFFETMVFGEDEMGQMRYATWDEALEGHQEILAGTRAKANPQITERVPDMPEVH